MLYIEFEVFKSLCKTVPQGDEHRVGIPSLTCIDVHALGEIKYAHIEHQIRYDLWKNMSLAIKI